MRKNFLRGKEWFFEDAALLGEPGTSVWGVIPEREVFSGKSRFQAIEIFDTREYGRVLALDGLVQVSTRHEFVYHEMLVHPALFCARRPGRALIIGGGDGGVLRELVKHPLKEILMVDIDREVVEVCRKYLPSLSAGAFEDQRVTLVHQDAFSIIGREKHAFDIIISDSTDPHGHSKALWTRRFYQAILEALSPAGIASFQTGYFKEGYALRARKQIRKIFPFSRVHRAFVGCYPFDECAFTVASRSTDLERVSLKALRKRFRERKVQSRYYSPEIHVASALIPNSMAGC